MNCCPFLSEKNPFERDIYINMQNLAAVGTEWKHPCVAHEIKRENSPRLFKNWEWVRHTGWNREKRATRQGLK